jgi:hypothetical protein
MIDQIFATYYIFVAVVWVCTWAYCNAYGGDKDWVFEVAGGIFFNAFILAAVHIIYYIWR